MKKLFFLPALALVCSALFSVTSSAQTCSGFTGANVQYMGVGSSAQFNSFAFAAEQLITNESGSNNVINFWASKSFPLIDHRTGNSDTAKVWVAWDNASDCNVYAYFSVDSTVGLRDFFAYQKLTNSFATNYDASAVSGNAGSGAACSGVINAGQPTCQTNGAAASTTLPSGILTFFNTQPGPTCKTGCTGNERATPLPYCGQHGTTATTTKWCFFNAGHSDIRPEDTLYATTRALSAYSSTNGLAGLGYAETGCGAANANSGCPIYESFGQGGVFYVSSFKLSGADPIGGGTVPGYVSLNIGAVPVVVFVNDSDHSGLGNGAPNNYTITNINRAVLAGFEDGTYSCSGDIQTPASPTSAPSFSAGQPVQVVQREPLSGTYNTFEFTAVRTLDGSASAGVKESAASSTSWFSDDESGQELNNDPQTNFGGSGCASNGTTIPSSRCGDPLYLQTGACGSNGSGLKVRAIGTGEEVLATLNGESGQSSSAAAAPDGLGYAFWGYGNFAKAAAGCGTNSGSVTCTSYAGHYLTVDGVDPLFNNPGDSTNPNGAYHLPQCYLSSGLPSCYQIPFTHIYDGSYPLWTVLRAVTFSTVSGTSGQTTPAAVVAIVAEAEKAANNANSLVTNLSDFVPYFTNINAGDTTGDLNLPVFRSHYHQTNNPVNGYIQGAAPLCPSNYKSISLTPVAGACTVDAGGDVGGTVVTMQSDADFNADFGSAAVGTSITKEMIGLHQ
ncbi:MAG: hypothetical protein WBX38_07655 [Candidatus Sulfotelmatobacter sp.]